MKPPNSEAEVLASAILHHQSLYIGLNIIGIRRNEQYLTKKRQVGREARGQKEIERTNVKGIGYRPVPIDGVEAKIAEHVELQPGCDGIAPRRFNNCIRCAR